MKAITANLFDLLFGCRHGKLSFPRSIMRGQRRSGAASQTGTYVVCLDCGREFAYDWQEMRIVADGSGSQARHTLKASSHKAA